MAPASFFQYAKLAYLSKPRADRQIFRAIRQSNVRSIVELGLRTGRRSTRMVQVALRYCHGESVRYAGIDLFEARPSDEPGLTLKRAHRLIKELGAKVQLIPGNPLSGLSRSANGLTQIDLVVVGADQDRDALAQAWFYVPRMLHDRSIVLLEEFESGKLTSNYRSLDLSTVKGLARRASQLTKRVA